MITLGTSKTGESADCIHSAPVFLDTLPAGMMSHPSGNVGIGWMCRDSMVTGIPVKRDKTCIEFKPASISRAAKDRLPAV